MRTRNGLAWMWMAALAAGVAGCGSGGPFGGGSSSSGGGTEPDLTVEEAYRRYFDASCDYGERCANVRGRDYTSATECKAALGSIDGLYEALTGTGYFATLAEGYSIPDQAKLRACINKLSTKACTDQSVRDPDCVGVLAPDTPVAVGQSCVADDAVCAEGHYCAEQDTRPGCALCTVYKANGQACEGNGECDSGFCTAGASGVCAEPAFKARGASCTEDSECVGAHVCAGPSGQRTCQERGGVGALCDGPEATTATRPSCMSDLECVTGASGVSGTCTARLADGQSCRRQGVNEPVTAAPCRNLCLFANGTAAMGTCGTPSAALAAGSACAAFQGSATTLCSLDDESTLYPNIEFSIANNMLQIDGCTCATQVPNGQPCWFDFACSTGICTGQNFQMETQGSCGPKLANGEDCDDDSRCDSDYCNLSNGQCAVKPTCP